jgi:uncharacterized protein YidB (DUF937 family)
MLACIRQYCEITQQITARTLVCEATERDLSMSILDIVLGALRNSPGQAQTVPPPAPGSMPEIYSQTQLGDLQGVIDRLSAGGLADQVRSWLGSGANLPVSSEQIRAALGDETVQQVARKFGIPTDSVLQLMSQFLPEAVDQASPNGTIEPQAQNQIRE